MREHPPDTEPEQEQRSEGGQDVRALVARHGPFTVLLRLLAGPLEELPGQVAVYACQAVVDGHPEIGVQPGLEIQHHINGRHDDARQPEPDARLVLEHQIDQSDDESENVQEAERIHFLKT